MEKKKSIFLDDDFLEMFETSLNILFESFLGK